VDEVLEIAQLLEGNGARFYRRASQAFTDSPGRGLLLDLAIAEDEHEKAFAAMRAELSSRERQRGLDDPYTRAVAYLRGMVDGRLFDVKADPSEQLTGKETTEEIIRTAIGLEKDAIIFYLGVKEMVAEGPGKQRIDAIIKGEMGHIASLNDALASLRG
ncbi:MAG TPA: ferritin family protein, partial [Dehalococcoidia bacterium]|nr:ferritin family protein [Dehalococcoidia bacterium]